MLLIVKKHYTRREEQPLPLPHPSKINVDCLFCQQLVDSGLGTKRNSNNDGKGFRLYRLLNHIQGCHKDVIIDDNARTLFDVGFSRARVGPTSLAQGGESRDGHFDGPTAIGTHDSGAVGATTPATSAPRGAVAATRFRIHVASAEMDDVVLGE